MQNSLQKIGLPLLVSGSLVTMVGCKNDKEGLAFDQIYKVPSCAAGEYYDGIAGACATPLAARPAVGFESTVFKDAAFDQQPTVLGNYITAYFSDVTGLTVSGVSCTREVVYDEDIMLGVYMKNFSFDCALTLEKAGEADPILKFSKSDVYAGEVLTAEELAEKSYDPLLKIFEDPSTGRLKVTYCEYSPGVRSTPLNDGVYDPIPKTQGDDQLIYPHLSSCVDFGTSTTIPDQVRGLDAEVVQFPLSLNKFLNKTQTASIVNGTTTTMAYAATKVAEASPRLKMTCDGVDAFFDIEFVPDFDSNVHGKLKILNTETQLNTFFQETVEGEEVNPTLVQDPDGFDFIESRSVLGCTSTACFQDEEGEFSKLSYTFFGDNILVTNPATGVTDIWTATNTSTYNFAGKIDGQDAVCPKVYEAASGG